MTTETLTFSPLDMGIPAARPRRYAILSSMELAPPKFPFTKHALGLVAFKKLNSDGGIFFVAPPERLR
eukprot:15439544-Alexandrium_andersonii.AAC.1